MRCQYCKKEAVQKEQKNCMKNREIKFKEYEDRVAQLLKMDSSVGSVKRTVVSSTYVRKGYRALLVIPKKNALEEPKEEGRLFDLDRGYAGVLKGEPIEAQIEEFLKHLYNESAADFFMQCFINFDSAKKHIMPFLTSQSQVMLKDVVHEEVAEGLSMAYRVDTDQFTAVITKQLYDSWKVSLAEIREAAIANLFASRITVARMENAYMVESDTEFGSAAIGYVSFLKELHKSVIKDSFYILPVACEVAALIPERKVTDLESVSKTAVMLFRGIKEKHMRPVTHEVYLFDGEKIERCSAM